MTTNTVKHTPDATREWQDISAAPKDGTLIIGFWEIYKRPCVMWWNFADQAFESWADRREEPTHWLPLPPAPQEKGRG